MSSPHVEQLRFDHPFVPKVACVGRPKWGEIVISVVRRPTAF
ncbi:MAG: hypothetical protein ACK4UY_10105 [Dietzia sp.]